MNGCKSWPAFKKWNEEYLKKEFKNSGFATV
jgi:hypothetical protein